MMPGMTGWRLTEELARTREPIPVVYMSGYPDPAHHLDEADNAAVLQKPFAPRTLLKAVQVAIDGPAPHDGSRPTPSVTRRSTRATATRTPEFQPAR